MKTEQINEYLTLTVGKIVARDYRKAMVFRSYGIDFCCGGNISMEAACIEAGADVNELLSEFEEIDENQQIGLDFESIPFNELIRHIVDVHHQYTRKTLFALEPLVNKVAMVHGGWRPELLEVQELFKDLIAELIPHMQKEEMVLFPAIQALENGGESPFNAQTIINPISMMELEHETAGELMKQIRELTEGFTLPKGACATYTVVYKTLAEFEEDLHKHIHLENNILFPRVIAMNIK